VCGYNTLVCVSVCLCDAVIRDEFREEPGDVELAAGHKATLRCRPPRAEPSPTVTWTKNGVPLPTDGDRVFVDETGSLHVMDARRDDNGQYRCVAENVAGSRLSAPARLTVRGEVSSRRPRFTITTCTSMVARPCSLTLLIYIFYNMYLLATNLIERSVRSVNVCLSQ